MTPDTALAARTVILLTPVVALALLSLAACVATWRQRRNPRADQ